MATDKEAGNIILVTGGARSGKSGYAQRLALQRTNAPVYIATAKVWDGDFESRVKRHQADRDERWTTVEEQRNVAGLLLDGKVCVVDCITLWLTNFFLDTKQDIEASLYLFKQEINALVNKTNTYIIITNEIGMGVHAETEAGRKFTDLQGWANQYVAAKAHTVVFMVSGLPIIVKGSNNLL